MGTSQILMPENYIAMFGAPKAEEARKIVKNAEPAIMDTIAYIKEEQSFPVPRINVLTVWHVFAIAPQKQ